MKMSFEARNIQPADTGPKGPNVVRDTISDDNEIATFSHDMIPEFLSKEKQDVQKADFVRAEQFTESKNEIDNPPFSNI